MASMAKPIQHQVVEGAGIDSESIAMVSGGRSRNEVSLPLLSAQFLCPTVLRDRRAQ
jgi:hypothetical protein